MTQQVPAKLTRKDFATDQGVRWCPGCGDYSILANVQKVLPTLGIPREKVVFISGIGCSSRFPYYMNTYGMHSIHGRAPSFATGLKVTRPDLSIWMITGDGDALSIGGNHFAHVLRRNVDINVLLFNNQIYGLTKGQYSPTSEVGKRTKSTPYGSVDRPLKPVSFALGSEATFVARTVDIDAKRMRGVLERAAAHRGTSFIEILQNCNIFNDGCHDAVTARDVKKKNSLFLEHGKPMIFGADDEMGIRLNGFLPEVVKIGENGVTEEDILVHDESTPEPHLAFTLSRFAVPDFPVPLGILRAVDRPTYDASVRQQIDTVCDAKGDVDMDTLLRSADTWTVGDRASSLS